MPTIEQLNMWKNKKNLEKNKLKSLENKLNKSIILGLDLSKNNPGLSIINKDTNQVLYSDNFKGDSKEELYFRMLEIKYWLSDIIFNFRPAFVLIEAPFISFKSTNGNDTLLQLNGYLRHFIKSFGIKIFSILPSQARAFLNIKPNTKEQAFEWVKDNFPEIELESFKKDNDRADAIIVGLNFFNPKKKEIFEVNLEEEKNERIN